MIKDAFDDPGFFDIRMMMGINIRNKERKMFIILMQFEILYFFECFYERVKLFYV